MSSTISDIEQLEYFRELIQPYTKRKEKRLFITQYLSGAGNELSSHFWSSVSSSRLAYDLYSWMKDEENVLDLQFEFHLPGLKSGGEGPNMDVFIETKDELVFIESKFTEVANLHYIDNGYLKKGYYDKEGYGRHNMPLEERFYNLGFSELFSKFCYKIEEIITSRGRKKTDGIDWFEPKQETCHLLGILFFLFDEKNLDRIKGKKIRLLNIYWRMPNDSESTLAKEFKKEANNLISSIKDTINCPFYDFEFDYFSIQDMLEDNSKLSTAITFPYGLSKSIENRNSAIVGEQPRGRI